MKKKRRTKFNGRLVRSYLTATISITLVLFLMGILLLLMLNAERLSDYVREHVGFTLILHDNVKEVDVLRLQKTLAATGYVRATKYVGKEEAAKQLAAELGEDFEGFLGFNPLFSSIDIKLHAGYIRPDSLSVLEKRFMEYPQVKEVYYQRDLVNTINKNVNKIGILLLVFSALLLLIFIALINNTIRISVYSQRFVINTMMLVGATRSFIRSPFLSMSIIYGLVAGLIANGAIFAMVWSYRKAFSEMIDMQQTDTLGITFLAVFLSGALISWWSTYFSVNKFLRLKFDDLFY